MNIKPWGIKGSVYNDMIHSSVKSAVYFQIALEMLPSDVFDELADKLAIICLTDMDACRVAREIAEHKDVILISERLIPLNKESQDSEVVIYLNFVVLHEVAHAYLKHKSQRYAELTKEQNNEQENEADSLALDWYNGNVAYINNPYLKPLSIEQVNSLRDENYKKLVALNA